MQTNIHLDPTFKAEALPLNTTVRGEAIYTLDIMDGNGGTVIVFGTITQLEMIAASINDLVAETVL